ncbi:DNA-binding transcriptional LysR family regulator [Silvibacterium bohemicum]|uniref:DNA-binding transcriptional LysR family regulator n=1 Tax=Silvibacterium bohemicum TaxID=1577686 RepID=A0A841JVI2_9BACT|nr:LysR family transcriptional regulator [Silvibacterium bohemicum]MBB6142448.1 DNA-binding transcriptional LysR family regulator [Silvibacterium bohemicum]
MELKQLRSFIAVARALNFSQAARDLHLSQPALSAQIKALEEDIGTLLLERNRRTVRLTRAGESLLADADVLLQSAEAARVRTLKIASGEAGHLRIAFVASATAELVPAIVLAFRSRYPSVTLELKNLPTVRQVEALEAHGLDVGFVRLPLTAPALSLTPLHSEPFALAISKSHRLANAKNLSIAQFANEPFVAYGQSWAPEFYQDWTGICRNAGFTPVVVQETAEMDTALALVAAGMGVAILPEGVANRYRRVIKVKPFLREKIRSQIGIAVARDRSDTLLQNFIALARKVVKHSST